MRRNLIGLGVMAALIVMLGLTSGLRVLDGTRERPVPSDFGVERSEQAPFEFGSVSDSQSFR